MSWPITGVGAVASVGRDVGEIFANLCAGQSGIGELRGFQRDLYTADYLFEIDDRPGPGRDEPRRATRFLLEAVRQAALDAGLGEDLSGVPVLVGTGLRELRSLELWSRDGVEFGPDELHFGPALRERFGADDTHTFSNACSAGLYALALAVDLLELGQAETVIVAGVDVVTESMFGLADRFQTAAPQGVAPFDRNRTGAILGEGAAAVVLRRRAADAPGPVKGVLRSVGVNCDAYHVTAPDPVGIAKAIREAHQRAGVTAQDVDLILLHGTGTQLNDTAEAGAVDEVFGTSAGRPLMTAIKSMTGHTSGGSGLLGLITAIQSLTSGQVPPTVGLKDPIDEAERFRLVRDEAAVEQMSVAQVNAFGFGGINAVAIVEVAR